MLAETVEFSQTRSHYLSFETEEGVFGFRYTTLKSFRWEAHGGPRDPQAIHFFFEAGTASVVGGDLRPLIQALHDEKLAFFKVGRGTPGTSPEVSFIRIVLAEEKKRFEARAPR